MDKKIPIIRICNPENLWQSTTIDRAPDCDSDSDPDTDTDGEIDPGNRESAVSNPRS